LVFHVYCATDAIQVLPDARLLLYEVRNEESTCAKKAEGWCGRSDRRTDEWRIQEGCGSGAAHRKWTNDSVSEMTTSIQQVSLYIRERNSTLYRRRCHSMDRYFLLLPSPPAPINCVYDGVLYTLKQRHIYIIKILRECLNMYYK